ncbi:aldehyde dehydrogenase family protein, partial [Mycolicibacterium poriferae]|uniref:aldehyde dehydrogenase family protein n=1 Tax=Mycolicibacterium poriferae TaxID=39694 RepID=UPI0024BBD3DC
MLSFTGSTEVGRLLYRQCAGTVKSLIMELGGHAPVLVFGDTDLDQAVEETMKAKFATSGQDCLGANRIFVERGIYDAFVEKFAAATKDLSIGIGMDDPEIGPLMNEKAVAKQEEHVADALKKGAKLVCGGDRHTLGPLFYQPTVLADVPADALILKQETFGPV